MARVFITGSSDSLGLAAAQSLIGSGHQVVLHARSQSRASGLNDLGALVVIGDLRSLEEAKGIADQVNAIGRMDAVIHNAGIYREPARNPTREGHASILAVNTLAPYVLTALIERAGRLVYLSSGLNHGGEGSLQDIEWTNRRWDTGRAYAESKLHMIALAFAIARRWPDVLSNAVDPGWARTRMGGAHAPVDLDTGQRTQSWLATSTQSAAMVTGRYWHNMHQEIPVAEARDASFQDALLEKLEQLTGIALP
jgi:NAD(P)-dependent dehydrogenase (short-subunit alcohol dehydrogenase family)